MHNLVRLILRETLELVKDLDHFTQGCLVRDAQGKPTAWCAKEAVCFCAIGATMRVVYDFDPRMERVNSIVTKEVRQRLATALGANASENALDWIKLTNDGSSREEAHARIVDGLRSALEAA